MHDHERWQARAAPDLAPLGDRLRGASGELWRSEVDADWGDNQRGDRIGAPVLYRSPTRPELHSDGLFDASPPPAPHIKGWPQVTPRAARGCSPPPPTRQLPHRPPHRNHHFHHYHHNHNHHNQHRHHNHNHSHNHHNQHRHHNHNHNHTNPRFVLRR